MFLDNKAVTILAFILIFSNNLYADLDSTEQRVLDLEIKTALNKINFSGELMSQGVYHKTKDAIGNINYEDKSFYGALSLNANAQPTPSISVHATLRGSYAYGESLVLKKVETESKMEELSGDDLKITRAYMDWNFLRDKLYFSAGRLPTSFGPPQHIYSNTERQGTYPLLAYSMPLDGFALTYNITSDSSRKMTNILRTVYSPQTNPSFDPLMGTEQGDRITKSTELYTLIYEHSQKKFLNKNIPILFIAQYFGGHINTERAIETRGALSSVTGADYDTYSIYGNSDTMQKINGINAYLEIDSPFNLPFTIYGSYTYNWLKKGGDLIAEVIDTNANSALTQSIGEKHNLGGFLYDDDESGDKYLIGAKFNKGNGWSLGIEYLKANFGTIITSTAIKRVTTFYELMGEGAHLYITKEITPHAADIRIGYSRTNEDYEYSNFKYLASNRQQDNAYLMMTVRF